MAKDILSDFGPDSSNPQVARAKSGGPKSAGDVLNYKAPQGPSSVNNPKAPGLHGTVYPSGSQTTTLHSSSSGKPGLGGDNNKSGSQR
jgi:hypothetical protein